MSIVVNEKEYFGIIYKIENVINHKVYIGQTTEPNGFNGRYQAKGVGIERVYNYHRLHMNRNAYYNVHLLSSIEKYGLEAFVVDEIFDTATSFEELNNKEIYYIAKFDSYNNGYNNTAGGNTYDVSKKPIGKDCHLSKRVCQIGLDGNLIKIWDALAEIERETGIKRGSISNVCLGSKKTAGGFVWVYQEDYDPNSDYRRIPKTKDGGSGTKPILWLDENENIIKEFYSGTEACKELKISPQEISRICLHKRKKPKFNLIYKNEYIEEQRLSVKDFVA